VTTRQNKFGMGVSRVYRWDDDGVRYFETLLALSLSGLDVEIYPYFEKEKEKGSTKKKEAKDEAKETKGRKGTTKRK
jgi:hypothetical protein